MSVNEKMTAIADAIRDKTGGTEPLSLDAMANGVSDVFEAGKKSEYDAFWDEYQNYGNRTDYWNAFSGAWGKNTFKPKYNIQPTYAESMFYRFNSQTVNGNSESVNLKETLDSLGVVLDFSKCTGVQYCFQNARISQLGVIDLSSVNGTIQGLFSFAYWLGSIEKIIVHEGITFASGCFNTESGTVRIIFEGTIATSLRIHCGLTKESFVSLINTLSDTASGQTLTIPLGSVNAEFESGYWYRDGSKTEEWLNLVASKPNWTITLV